MTLKRKLLLFTGATTSTMMAYNYYRENFTTDEYLVYQKYPFLRNFDITDKKVARFVSDDPEERQQEESLLGKRAQAVKWNLDWYENSPVLISEYDSNNPPAMDQHDDEEVHVFVGGLQALFACAQFLEAVEEREKQSAKQSSPSDRSSFFGSVFSGAQQSSSSSETSSEQQQQPTKSRRHKCIFINDGKPLIAQRAGLQLHEHPTQYPDYGYLNLFKKVLQAFYVLPEDHPERYDYSPLHLNFSVILKDPINVTMSYASFFFTKLWHSYTNKRGVSEDDYNLILMIRQSVNYMQELDKKIRSTTGKSIINRNGRIYWSANKKEIEKKKEHWSAMGIPLQDLDGEEINAITLLHGKKSGIYGIRMPNDGEIHPDLPEIVIEYLYQKYPQAFEYHVSSLSNVFVDKDDKNTARAITEQRQDGSNTSLTYPVESLYCSLGHHDIYGSKSKKRQFTLVAASGVTSDWRVTISKERLRKRVESQLIKKGLTLEEYLQEGYLVPSADMYNLHVKFIDHHYDENSDNVTLIMRVTEGANLFSTLSDKRDLINIAYKLNKFFVGDWKIMCAGTCSRQTGAPNRPQVQGPFHYGQSGVGISLSAGKENFGEEELAKREFRL